MATEIEINAVVDAVITAFDNDPALWTAFLERSKLETEAAALESQVRIVTAARDADVTAAEVELQALQAALNTKLAEIDAL